MIVADLLRVLVLMLIFSLWFVVCAEGFMRQRSRQRSMRRCRRYSLRRNGLGSGLASRLSRGGTRSFSNTRIYLR